jgi:tubulin-like protein CetZ
MKISVIGIGQCGCNIADEFWNINNYSKSFFGHGLDIVVDAFAVNTDETDLATIKHIASDKHHRIVIGVGKSNGHGVGKINTDGSKIMKEYHNTIIDGMLNSGRYHESDGTIVIAGGAGGTGSGGIGWLVKGLRERLEKPVYAVVVLPFAYEQEGEYSYAVTNTAMCLKTVREYANAVFVLDNERFAKAGTGISNNFQAINQLMVKDFFDLFCAGEEHNSKHIGSKVIDAGDIKESLEDICAIGRGAIPIETFLGIRKDNYRVAAEDSIKAMEALKLALNNLSLKVNIEDAAKILVILSAPRDTSTLSVLAEISNHLQEKAPKAILRIGDYPRNASEIVVTAVLSKLTAAPKVQELFLRAEYLLKKREEINAETAQKISLIDSASSNIPTLDR